MVAAVVEAGLELDSFFFSTGLLVSDDAVVLELLQIFSSALAGFAASSAFASLFSVAAGVSATSAFSVAGAGASGVAAELGRSTFSAGAPSP